MPMYNIPTGVPGFDLVLSRERSEPTLQTVVKESVNIINATDESESSNYALAA